MILHTLKSTGPNPRSPYPTLSPSADFAAGAGGPEAPDGPRGAIAEPLARHAPPKTPEAVAQVGDLVARALSVPLPGTATLARLPASRRVAAMEFHFRLRSTRVSALYALLVEHG